MNDSNIVRWSVWTARVRFEDSLEIKTRPVVILDNDEVRCVCLALPITSKRKDERHSYLLRNWEYSNLRKESTVKLQRFEIRHCDLFEFIGMLDATDIYNLNLSLNSGRYGSGFV